MTNPKKRIIKIVNSFYTYHPDFVQHDDGLYEELPTGWWIAEWTVQEQDNLIQEHYTAKFTTEQQADAFLDEITSSFWGAELPYKSVLLTDPIFTAGKLVAKIKHGKPISKDHW